MESYSFKDVIITISSGVIVLLLLSFKSYVIKTVSGVFEKEKKDPVILSLNLSKVVQDSINHLLIEWDANRVYIIQFHNGGHFYTGATMQKYSVTYEDRTPGTIPLCSYLQNIQLSTNTYIKNVVDNEYKIDNTEEIVDIISRTFYNEFHIKSAIGVPIYKNKLVIGAIIINYTDIMHKFSENDIDLLSMQCTHLHSLLLVE